jgi:molybdate transport system ATP-binding protein
VFLSADDERPRQAVERGFAVPESRFTYAVGKLVLWSRVKDVTDGGAPYGTAAFDGGRLIAPAPPATIGEKRRIRILVSDVSLARDKRGRSSILNVLPSRIVTMKPLDAYEILAVVAAGENGEGAKTLSRMTLKSWAELGLAPGQNVFAQVKYVTLDAGRGPPEE